MQNWVNALVLLICVALGGSTARAADPITVKIPCGTAPWPTCEALKQKLIDGVATSEFPGGMKVMVRQLLDDVYLGKVRLSPNLVGEAECTTFDQMSVPPICPVLKVPENGCVDEFTRAHKAPADPNCPAISLVGAAGGDRPIFTLGGNYTRGSLETANMAGALVLAVSNEAVDLQAQVSKNELKVLPESACHAKAVALQGLITAQSDVRLLEQVRACDPNGQTQACSAKQYFDGAVTTILSAYLQLAKCRLVDEASRKYVAFMKDSGSPDRAYPEILRNIFVQQCFYPYVGNPTSMRQCYASKYKAWVQDRARAAFPRVAAGCP